MISKLPIIDASVAPGHVISAVMKMIGRNNREDFRQLLAAHNTCGSILLTSSGIAAFYLLLEAMKQCSLRREVLLPAYTAGSLVVAVQKAGLTPILCDVDTDNVNAHAKTYAASVTERTLAVVAVHLFGLPVEGIEELRQSIPPEVFFIEDCAQAMGTMVAGKPVGVFSDAALFSFNRGKNLSLGSGGYAHIFSEALQKLFPECLPVQKSGFSAFLTLIALSLAANRLFYGLMHPLLSRFKETAPPSDIIVGALSGFQAALGTVVYRAGEHTFEDRLSNARTFIQGLSGCPGITVPYFRVQDRPALNRFPLLCENADMRFRIKEALWRAGIETSEMYMRPLHHMFRLGYPSEAFPHARALAERLLTLPVHPRVTKGDIDTMITAIKKIARRQV